MATLTIEVDGVTRTAESRNAPNATEAFIVLHGGGSLLDRPGLAFMSKVKNNPLGCMLVFPDAMEVPSTGVHTWVHLPSQAPFLPPLPVDIYTDIRYLEALAVQIKAQFPAITKVTVGGFSQGGSMVMWLMKNWAMAPNIDGYWISHMALTEEYTIDNMPSTRPAGYWVAADDQTQHEGGRIGYNATAAQLAAAYGVTEIAEGPPEPCCNLTKNKKLHVRLFSPANIFSGFWIAKGGHAWVSKTACACAEELKAKEVL